ncbi:MAG: phosphoadenylyl-sulfate reductase [Flavobacteriaceae bacterium]|nr:MAG: phosphoadenylyl-sulfate reductase [Flavobacteriaceae bacterium]
MKGTINQLIRQAENKSIEDTLGFLSSNFPNQVVFSSSLGQEDQAITHMIATTNLPIEIFMLDTGRHFQETYDVLSRTRKKYNLEIKSYFPQASDIENLLNTKGPNSFFDSVENRKECCFLRKVKPLKIALNGKKIWVTGLRASQSENRETMQLFEYDEGFDIIKYNPLIHWSFEELNEYLDKNKVPQNSLHKKNFPSIGCAPCTRAIMEGEDIRAGRWYWENSQKECGLHSH